MKKKLLSVIVISILIMSSGLLAQEKPFDELIKKYGDEDGITTVVITGEMFQLFSNLESDEEAEEFSKLMNSLSSIKILNLDKTKYKDAKLDFYYKLMEDLPKDNYIELMTIKEKDQNVKFYIKKLDTGKIGEMIMISSGADDNTLISITGKIDLNDMSKLSHSLGIKGLENLKELEIHESEIEKTKQELEQTKQELEKQKQEMEKQKQEMEKQRKEMEKQMQELEEEKRK